MKSDFKLIRSGLAHYFMLILTLFSFVCFVIYSYQIITDRIFNLENLASLLFLGFMAFSIFAYFNSDKIFFSQGLFTFRFFIRDKHKYGLPVVVKKTIRDDEIDFITIARAEYFQSENKKNKGNDSSNEAKQVDFDDSIEMSFFKKFTLNKIKVETPYFIYVKSKNSTKDDIFFDTKDQYSKINLKSFQNFLNKTGIKNEFIE